MNASQLDRLQNQFYQIDALLEGLTSNFLQKKHHPEKWSIHENLAHLGRYHEIFQLRISKILAEANPQFGRYRAEEDPFFEKWTTIETTAIIKKTKHLRKIIFSLIANLSESELQKTGSHPKFKTLTLTDWIEFFLLHEMHHFYTIFQLKWEYKS